MRKIKGISFGVASLMFLSLFSTTKYSVVKAEEKDYGLNNPRINYNYRDTVVFGNYWQEDTNGDGEFDNDEKQPIVWQILEKYSDGTALLLSDKILDSKEYCSNYDTTTDGNGIEYPNCSWENSSIRKWLNDDFLNSAFSDSEQTAIKKSNRIDSVQDSVFLLSTDDLKNVSYGFNADLRYGDQSRLATETTYAKRYNSSNGYWWLSTIATDKWYVDIVSSDGLVGVSGGSSLDNINGVRPAIVVDLSASFISSGERIKTSVKGSEWDTVIFGKYNDKDITWKVLNVEGDNALLLSDSVLDYSIYDQNVSVTWKDSVLRSWLNYNFYENAFSDNEKTIIKTTKTLNDYNYEEESEKNTSDKVFLLSLLDIVNPSFGFADAYNVYTNTRLPQNLNLENYWWLRTPGNTKCQSCVESTGRVTNNELKSYKIGGVCPCIFIDLSKSYWKKGETVIAGDSLGGIEIPLDSSLKTEYPLGVNEPITPINMPSPTSTPSSKPVSTPTIDNKPTLVPSKTPDNTDSVATPTVSPSEKVKPSVTPTVSPTATNVKDNKTTFKIGTKTLKNKKTIKKKSKIKITDKDKIKKITLNGKAIKIKKNKTSFTLKLKSYKKKLKKKGKWNTLKVIDNKGNVKTIKFKTK